jgi:NTP pyrophosphatase (non-canonical NTP hydrolase)
VRRVEWPTGLYAFENETEDPTWRRELYEAAAARWGLDAQFGQAVEELGELLVALRHYQRGRISREAVLSEVADVRIMCEQVAYLLAFEPSEVLDEEGRKLFRLRERLDRFRTVVDVPEPAPPVADPVTSDEADRLYELIDRSFADPSAPPDEDVFAFVERAIRNPEALPVIDPTGPPWLYCSTCELSVEDCACKGGPTG